MALSFSNSQKPEQQFREELRILATQIETINQQLAGGTGGGGGPALQRSFQDVSAKLAFIYEFLKTMQADLKEEQKSSFEEVHKSVNATLQKNLPDIYAKLQDLEKATKGIQVTGGGAASQDVEDIKSTLKQLIVVYKEEVGIFKQQNEFLQKKLVDIDMRLQNLEK